MDEKLYNGFYVSPIGNLSILASEKSLYKVAFEPPKPDEDFDNSSNFIISETIKQLDLYFSKRLKKFDLPIEFRGTEFQKKVLEEIKRIPFGQTVTYMQLAKRMGSSRLTRAVAAVNAANSLLIILPCHRVVGKNNTMTGYSGEIWRKEWLLNHEHALMPQLL